RALAARPFGLPQVSMLMAREDRERREDVVAHLRIEGRRDLHTVDRQTVRRLNYGDLLGLQAIELGQDLLGRPIARRDEGRYRLRRESPDRARGSPEDPSDQIASIPRCRRTSGASRLLESLPQQRQHADRRQVQMRDTLARRPALRRRASAPCTRGEAAMEVVEPRRCRCEFADDFVELRMHGPIPYIKRTDFYGPGLPF